MTCDICEKRCEMCEGGADKLDQSGLQYLPAIRWVPAVKPTEGSPLSDCSRGVVMTLREPGAAPRPYFPAKQPGEVIA